MFAKSVPAAIASCSLLSCHLNGEPFVGLSGKELRFKWGHIFTKIDFRLRKLVDKDFYRSDYEVIDSMGYFIGLHALHFSIALDSDKEVRMVS